MSAAADLQEAIARVLEGALEVVVPVVRWRAKDLKSDTEATLAAQSGLCIFVPVPVPTSALQGSPVVFFDGFECRVQIIEIPNAKVEGLPELHEMIEAVALALHWQPKSAESPLAGMLAHPLHLAQRPVETAEGVVAVPGFEHQGEVIKAADVIFNAVLQINA